jgi:thiamine-phosphate pyrophosphorylase
MEVIAISPESGYQGEALVVERLLDAGLYRYHLRKPAFSAAQLAQLLEQLPPDCRRRVVLHQHPELVAVFDLGGYHFKDRPDAVAERDEWLAQPGMATRTVSRSLHAIDDLAATCAAWDYTFISPVFASISKPGYRSRWTENECCAALRPLAGMPGKRYALGGVSADNYARCLAMGFDGVVLHGALWRAADPVAALEKI